MEKYDVLIVGAGHGGAQVATALRQRQFSGTLALIGEEPYLPYERPPLSKEYLSREKDFERILIRPSGFWHERGISTILNERVIEVQPAVQVAITASGRRIGYGCLVWAAGGDARKLSCGGHDLEGVHTIRTRADVDRVMMALPRVTNIAVVGGGYIGLEAASALRKLGKTVTVLEGQNRVLARVAGPTLSLFFENEHRAHGADIRLGEQVVRLEGDNGRISGVRLAGDNFLPADMVIAGIGIVPAVGPLVDAGAPGENGVLVDEYCRTALPNVYAIGDCALHINRFAGNLPIRLESVQNATDMANVVAKAIVGTPEEYRSVPWFWSNQYDIKLQTVGLSIGYDTELVRGDPGTRCFSVIYLREGAVIALDCVNATRDYVQGKALVASRAVVDPDKLSDPDVPLKSLSLSHAE